MSRRLAVLLRAVNVGGTGKLAMADFKAVLEALGYAEAKTLGAAGSAVVATDAGAEVVEAAVARALDRLGLRTEVYVRTHGELGETLAANPFPDMARDKPSGLIVSFMKSTPTAAAADAVRARIAGHEDVAAGPRCLYIAYGEGMGRSKLTGQILDKALGQQGTGRNWNTVQKLHELTAAHGSKNSA